MKSSILLGLAGAASLNASAMGQSLFRQPQAPQPAPQQSQPTQPGQTGQPPAAAPETGGGQQHTDQQATPDHHELRQASLMMVEPPKPKGIAVHDIVFIIINETSTQSSQQVLDAKKDSSLKAAVNKFPDIALFFQGNLTNTNSGPIAEVDTTASSKFKGDGKFTRDDKFQDKIAASVIDVKPNGVLVLEARKTVGQDKEVRTLVLSGQCRREDVTDNNSVLSTQLADLTILAHAEGDAKDTASKGLLTKLMEGIFNF